MVLLFHSWSVGVISVALYAMYSARTISDTEKPRFSGIFPENIALMSRFVTYAICKHIYCAKQCSCLFIKHLGKHLGNGF